MSQAEVTIYVLAFPEAFEVVFNTLAMVMKGNLFSSLLKLAALWGIILSTAGFIKSKDPLIFAKWIALYTFVSWAALTPKATVHIQTTATADTAFKSVSNVPWIAAEIASLITTVGFGITEEYERLTTLPDSLRYSQTGLLFGSHLMRASLEFQIVSPELKADMDSFFRQCVVGDIAITRDYSVGDLKTSKDLFGLVFSSPSPVRHTTVHDKANKKLLNVSCLKAANNEKYGLKKRLEAEVDNAYTLFGHRLFPMAGVKRYKELFEAHLESAYQYMQGITDNSTDIVLQTMMSNAMHNGMLSYGARVDSNAAITNAQFSKSQVQHRKSWEISANKAEWILPEMHTILLALLFAAFPILFIAAAIPGGWKLIKYYLLFMFSLQLWPACFSVLNAFMVKRGETLYSSIGDISSINFDAMAQAHSDLSGLAGYFLFTIPFISWGLLTNIGSAFSNLATSVSQHMQGSSMAIAGEAANASFSLGNNSFYNTTANNLSANKHDTNYTDMSGQRSVQMASGLIETTTGTGSHVYNAEPTLSKSAVSIASSTGLQGSLSKMSEENQAAQLNAQVGINAGLSLAGRHALQYNESSAFDERLGNNLVSSEQVQAQQALHRAWETAEGVANRTGVSTEEAFAELTKKSLHANAGFDLGKIPLVKHLGVSAGGGSSFAKEDSNNYSERDYVSKDLDTTAREVDSFRDDLSIVDSYAQNHSLDSMHSNTENLLVQVGHDLQNVRNFSDNLSASIIDGVRIAEAQSFVSTNAATLNHNLNQEAITWISEKYDPHHTGLIAALEGATGDAAKQAELRSMKEAFLEHKAQSLIEEGSGIQSPGSFYDGASAKVIDASGNLYTDFHEKSQQMTEKSKARGLGINSEEKARMQQGMPSAKNARTQVHSQGEYTKHSAREAMNQVKTRRSS